MSLAERPSVSEIEMKITASVAIISRKAISNCFLWMLLGEVPGGAPFSQRKQTENDSYPGHHITTNASVFQRN